MHLGLAQGVTLVYLSLAWFGLIDGVIEWVARRRSVPLGWAALVVLPLALSFEAIWPLFFAAGCLGAAGFHLTRRRLKHQSDPESLLLFFCSRLSTVLSGAAAGLTIALFLFSAGLLDLWELWSPGRLGALGSGGGGGRRALGRAPKSDPLPLAGALDRRERHAGRQRRHGPGRRDFGPFYQRGLLDR